MSGSSISEKLQEFADEMQAVLARHAGAAGSEHRRRAAERLAARLRRIAGTAPEAATDEGSRQAIEHAMKMIRTVFPSWSPRTKEETGEDA